MSFLFGRLSNYLSARELQPESNRAQCTGIRSSDPAPEVKFHRNFSLLEAVTDFTHLIRSVLAVHVNTVGATGWEARILTNSNSESSNRDEFLS